MILYDFYLERFLWKEKPDDTEFLRVFFGIKASLSVPDSVDFGHYLCF